MAGGIEVRPTAGRPATSNAADARADRALRADRRKAGLCTSCGGSRDVRHRRLCTLCASIIRASNARMRARRQAAGLCQECGAPGQGRVRCKTCVLRRNARPSRSTEGRKHEHQQALKRTRAQRKAWRRQALCTNCGEPRDDQHLTCESCRKRAAAFQRTTSDRKRAQRVATIGDLTTTQAAKLLVVSSHTVRVWCRDGKLPHGKSGRIRYLKTVDVLAFKAERKQRQTMISALSLPTFEERRAGWYRDRLCTECGAARSPNGGMKCEPHRLANLAAVRRYAAKKAA